MKHWLLVPLFAAFCWQPVKAQGKPTVINLPVNISHCALGTPALLMWTGTTFGCVSIGSGMTISGGVISALSGAPYAPVWQVETVSLANVAPGASTVVYTTLKTPLSAVPILWWYYPDVVNLATSGSVFYAGQPLTITLPVGWTPTDVINIAYQSQ